MIMNTTALSTLQRLYLKETGIDYLWGKSIMSAVPVKSATPVVLDAQPLKDEVLDKPLEQHVVDLPKQLLEPSASFSGSASRETVLTAVFGEADLLKPLVWDLSVDLPEHYQKVPYQRAYEFSDEACLFSVGSDQASIFIAGIGGSDVSEQSPLVPQAQAMMDSLSYLLGWQLSSNLYLSQLVLKQHCPDWDKMRLWYLSALWAQIEQVRPRCLLVWGKLSQYILGQEHGMDLLRQSELSLKLSDGSCVPIIFTHHPFYLSRLPMLKEQAWVDVCRVQNLVFRDLEELGS